MLPDLKLLIQLQELDSAAERLRRRMADIPAAQAALDARLAELTGAVAGVKERIAASQTARRDIEKDLAAVQTRLSKYKDQLMEVKTNKEYHAMQTEIASAETVVRREEDRLLERMEEARNAGRRPQDCREPRSKSGQAEVDAQPAGDGRRADGEPSRTCENARRTRAGRRRRVGWRACPLRARLTSTARAWRCQRPETACARNATSGCARRSITSFVATKASCSARAAREFSSSSRRPCPRQSRANESAPAEPGS